MKVNKALGFAVAFALSATLMCASAYAATYSAGVVAGDAGTAVSVPVVVTPDSGETEQVNGYVMTLTYDPTQATPVVAGTDLTGGSCYAAAGTGFTDGILVSDKISTSTNSETLVVAWAGAEPVSIIEATNMATVNFNVASTASADIPVAVAVTQLTNDGASIADSSTYTVASGTIDLADDIIYGDVNGTGTVDAGDASYILQCVAEYMTFTEEQIVAGDVNGTGTVDSGDASYILQYVAEYITSFPVEQAQ